jgi:hypothetical protein
MGQPVTIGGAPVVSLQATDAPPAGPAILSADVLPGRGFMLLRAGLRLPSGAMAVAVQVPEQLGSGIGIEFGV